MIRAAGVTLTGRAGLKEIAKEDPKPTGSGEATEIESGEVKENGSADQTPIESAEVKEIESGEAKQLIENAEVMEIGSVGQKQPESADLKRTKSTEKETENETEIETETETGTEIETEIGKNVRQKMQHPEIETETGTGIGIGNAVAHMRVRRNRLPRLKLGSSLGSNQRTWRPGLTARSRIARTGGTMAMPQLRGTRYRSGHPPVLTPGLREVIRKELRRNPQTSRRIDQRGLRGLEIHLDGRRQRRRPHLARQLRLQLHDQRHSQTCR